MLKYIIIQLDDTSCSFCHYDNNKTTQRIISIDDLRSGVLFAMKENLKIQYILPNYKLPKEYLNIIESVDNCKITSIESVYADIADVIVIDSWKYVSVFREDCIYVLKLNRSSLFEKSTEILNILKSCSRLNIIITDVEKFGNSDFEKYKSVLECFAKELEKLYIAGKFPQLNLITDRMMLDTMNNCNAGWENITLAPDGKFYVCPAFYLVDDEEYGLGKSRFSIGDLNKGLNIKNPHLYKLTHSPLCRICDAYQCKRCVWLNRKTTFEMNTPSHEQCVIAHLERNASRSMLLNIRKFITFLSGKDDLNEISYLDPFDVEK